MWTRPSRAISLLAALFLIALVNAAPVQANEKPEPVLLDWLWLIPDAIIEEMLAAYDDEVEDDTAYESTDEAMPADGGPPGIDHQNVGQQDLSEWGRAFVETYNGKNVKIPGFMLPLSYEEGTVQDFLLVPYYGACIHVPPPPPNQIIVVRSETPIKIGGMFDPIYVTGIMSTQTTQTEFAEAGYHITASLIEPYTE